MSKDTAPVETKQQRGIQSLDSSGVILNALVAAGRPLSLKDLAGAANMPTAKAFPHLVSLLKTGMLSRDADGCFAPGPLSLQLGLLALQGLSPTREAEQEILHMSNATGMSVAMAVLGPLGPTILRLEESARPQHISLRLGTVMSLVNTAIGRVFAAYLPNDVLDGLLAQDAIRMAGQVASGGKAAQDYRLHLQRIARDGIDSALDAPVPGIHTLAAPVFDHTGSICMVIALIGAAGSFDANHAGDVAQILQQAAQGLSIRLGHAGKTGTSRSA
ncbi:IclR family transcriptional regulator [Undibacterium sp.]|jgi:DNA-binding IclR family transcriptional regulator|uniref:IclR family transcriptional regulator n=1 Tax=Undibacterium sp. TaxID=1914977 RepID=UPI002BAC0CE5|nr:IclR family transcriptional regulator C-terminal domain-containing protein [Undibacterium sp.]HTD03251.1 IclR family transcriptional regulator C-terminal domain-containing protein [Undibacterium sp.]